MHDKVAIIDGYIVITGSYNWSNNAENNNNGNMIIIRINDIAGKYEVIFQQVWTCRR